MDTTVISALIGAVVALIVAIITAIITVRGWQEENRRLIKQQQREAKLEHLQRQIEELYGPLWGLVQQSQIIYDVAVRVLPSENGKVRQDWFEKNDDRHWKVWRFFAETYFLPLHSQKAELINTKSYLLESGQLPESFDQFLKHEAQSGCLYRLWKEQGVSTQGNPDLKFPAEFNQDVKTSLDNLKSEYETLLKYEQGKKASR
ncbi:MAG: hypothetical protein V7L00_19755 [Nostoc sp.]|uniref:hypothetical protein n=1 Tax=Nostoc sp. TaxID=1180 RepID=UPI002FF98AF9